MVEAELKLYKSASVYRGLHHVCLTAALATTSYADVCKLLHSSSSTAAISVTCPRVNDPSSYTSCCTAADFYNHSRLQNYSSNDSSRIGSLGSDHVCCEVSDKNGGFSVGKIIAIVLAVIIAIVFITLLLMAFLWKIKKAISRTQLPKYIYSIRLTSKINTRKHKVGPLEKKTLLKTAHYTVEKVYDDVTVRFHQGAYFEHFHQLLMSRYRGLEVASKQDKIATVSNSEGKPVTLYVSLTFQFIRVTDEGNTSWVMNDFQNICKNIQVSDIQDGGQTGTKPQQLPSYPLLPRLPTIDEQHYTAEDYFVKITQTEIDIKFHSQVKYKQFKKAVLLRYSDVLWSKMLQRYCAHVKVKGDKLVNIHLWQEICSIWLSGDGKMIWYQNDFEEILQQSRETAAQEYETLENKYQKFISLHFADDLVSEKNIQLLPKEVPIVYSVKSLNVGEYELEFPDNEYLLLLHILLSRKYPEVTWKQFSDRHMTSISQRGVNNVTVQLSTPLSEQTKIWIYDDNTSNWINNDFRELYSAMYWCYQDGHRDQDDNDDITTNWNLKTELEAT